MIHAEGAYMPMENEEIKKRNRDNLPATFIASPGTVKVTISEDGSSVWIYDEAGCLFRITGIRTLAVHHLGKDILHYIRKGDVPFSLRMQKGKH